MCVLIPIAAGNYNEDKMASPVSRTPIMESSPNLLVGL
jgi:hypothetical protein